MFDRSLSLLDDAEDVVLAQNQVLFPVDLHFGARVLAEQNGVAGFHVELSNFAVLEDLAVTYGDDFALDGLFFGAVRDDDPALALLFFLDPLDNHAVLQRSYAHDRLLRRWVLAKRIAGRRSATRRCASAPSKRGTSLRIRLLALTLCDC